ncbi:hypothetical protein [Nocardia asteroides]|uniref:hypothetical protein n=1 Tax=Nocardia asteroides TaxID=1824 RepID=UPI0033FCD0E9
MTLSKRNTLAAVAAVLGIGLSALAIDAWYSVTYGSWTWMFTPPPRIDDTKYSRIDSAPEGSAEYERLTTLHGGSEPADRRWPLPFAIERSVRGCDQTPWLLYVHDYTGTVHLYGLNSGCA